MNKTILNIDGMTCSACSNGLEKYLKKQPGIITASVNLILGQALIEYENTITMKDLENYVQKAGFKVVKNIKEKNSSKLTLILYALLMLVLMYIAMGHMLNLPTLKILDLTENPHYYAISLLILTIPFLIYGIDIIKSGIKNLVHKMPNMDTLVTIGVLASFIYSFINTVLIFLGNITCVHNLYYESSAMIILLIKVGRYIDSNNKAKTKEAVMDLVKITPEQALIKKQNEIKEITIDEIKKGDILICKPGMKIAVDGKVVTGNAHLDETFITGESVPIMKQPNDKVIAGSLNYDGYLEYQAEKIGKDSTISEIVNLVVQATNTKTPLIKMVDKVSGIFVPIIIVIAVITFIGYLILGLNINTALIHFVNVLVVACPCALGLATPLALIISAGECASKGILIKSNTTLENAHKIDSVLFDKTGTLTYGKLKIAQMKNYSEYSDSELLKIVASLEAKTKHPIATAFTEKFSQKELTNFEITNFKELTGIGLEAVLNNEKIYIGNKKLLTKLKIKNDYQILEQQFSKAGNSIIYVIINNQVLGIIGLKDIIRNDTKKVIEKLTQEVIMLSGDNKLTAQAIACQLGIKKVYADLMPKDKVNIINELLNDNKKVMMVGDGINDAPSLASASIGVSLGSATEIANNSADVILINDNLKSIHYLIKTSKKTATIIKQNLFWAFAYNIIMLPIAIGFLAPFGIDLSPMLASFAMMLSSLTVVLNSLRLKHMC